MRTKLQYLLIFIIVPLTYGQTNVNGGIFNNTTWDIGGSPYIVTADVALYPEYSLTIEPGVTIKFNEGTKLIVRGTLLASASVGNEITFTSNISNPTKGSWKGIEIENDQGGKIIASNLIGEFADKFISILDSTYSDEVININNSEIRNCSYAFYGYDKSTSNSSNISNRNLVILDNLNVNNITYVFAYAENLIITNSAFSNGEKGITGKEYSFPDNVYYSQKKFITNSEFFNFNESALDFRSGEIKESHIHHNGIGLKLGENLKTVNSIIEFNVIGVEVNFLNQYSSLISNNKICNNSQYNFKNTNNYPIDVINNFWCIDNETDISQTIFDAYDDVNLGIVDFTPFNNSFVTLTSESFLYDKKKDFIFYPNPVNNEIFFSDDYIKNFEIYSIKGKIIKKGVIENNKLNLSDLSKGIYLIKIFDINKLQFSIKKLLKI
jgi:hypothetical protein